MFWSQFNKKNGLDSLLVASLGFHIFAKKNTSQQNLSTFDCWRPTKQNEIQLGDPYVLYNFTHGKNLCFDDQNSGPLSKSGLRITC